MSREVEGVSPGPGAEDKLPHRRVTTTPSRVSATTLKADTLHVQASVTFCFCPTGRP